MNKDQYAPYERAQVIIANSAIEAAALVADAEAQRLDELAAGVRAENANAPRRGLKWREEELKAGARAARRIAIDIRKLAKTEEEG
jgi:hypothetical protein